MLVRKQEKENKYNRSIPTTMRPSKLILQVNRIWFVKRKSFWQLNNAKPLAHKMAIINWLEHCFIVHWRHFVPRIFIVFSHIQPTVDHADSWSRLLQMKILSAPNVNWLLRIFNNDNNNYHTCKAFASIQLHPSQIYIVWIEWTHIQQITTHIHIIILIKISIFFCVFAVSIW